MRRLVLLLTLLLLVGCAPMPAEPPAEPPALEYHGVLLTVGMTEETMLRAMGTDYRCSEAESCAGEGVDRMYTYPSVRIYVFAPEEGEASVTSVSYTDDGVSTDGVCIGCDASVVEQVFGAPDERREGVLVYRRGGAELTVTVRDGRVSAVVLSEES